MVRFSLVLPLLGTLAAAQPGTGKAPPAPALPPDVAALVGGEAISMKEVYARLWERYGRAVLDELVKEKLAEQEARRLGISVDEKAVAKKVREWEENFLQRFHGDRKAAAEVLRRQGSSLAETLASMRRQHRTEYLWREIVRRRKKPDLRTLKSRFEFKYGKDGIRLKVAHILFTTNVNDPRFQDRYTEREHYRRIDALEKEAAARARELAARARRGEDFARLAEKHSDDWSARSGGLLGAYWQNRFGKAFDTAVARAKIGDIVGPIAFREGFVIAKVEPAEYDTLYVVRHIFLAYTPATRDRVLDRAYRLKERLDRGEDFARVARVVSEDPLTKEAGGLWEPFRPEEKVESIRSALERMQPGQISDPVLTPFGVHLLKLEKVERKPKGGKKAVRVIVVSTAYSVVREKVLKPQIEKEAYARARETIRLLEEGADFARLARERSDDKFTATNGGVFRDYSERRVSPAFHRFVLGLQPGQVAPEPFKSDQGYHVVKLLEKRRVTFEEVKDELFQEELAAEPSPAEIMRVQQELMQATQIVRRK